MIGRKATRTQPAYPLEVVGDDLPDNPRHGRSGLYFNLLEEVRANPHAKGKWVLLAEFQSHTGAKDAVDAIRAGERDIPAPAEWEFEWRKMTDEVTGKRTSNLYVKYQGELESAG